MQGERVLLILEFLERRTDADHFVSIKEIKDYLENECNYESVTPITIRRDLMQLNDKMGKKIETKKAAHNRILYSLSENGFTFNEIRFLVDSVSINQFLSNAQKQQLIKKFEGMCSESEVRKLISRIQLNEIAPTNLNLLDNLDKVHEIISEGRKINFEYGKFDTQKKMKYYKKSRNIVPLNVLYSNNRFYLKCIKEEDCSIRTYRIDRMKNIQKGEKTKGLQPLPKPEGAVLDIFEPNYFEIVHLRVKQFLLDDMLEKFGKYASIRPDPKDSEFILIRAKVGISDNFYHWVLRYGSDIEILSPKSIREYFIEELKIICKIYEK